ncbi:MmcQ/YjbR family DNA-binding protein [Alistipes sp.]|uniref:MmcQ/YjbR family DNA-binding protein n=1 Tax=Alistipes sp. TaxID=1872444 RepID=UPI003AF0F937
MDLIALRNYCLSLPLTEESTPFDQTTLVYKVGGKMYACTDMAAFEVVAVKCDPDEAVALRERYPEIDGARHFDKRHWNGIRTDGDLPDAFIRQQIRNSYLLVLRQNVTPRARREEILRYIAEHGLPE